MPREPPVLTPEQAAAKAEWDEWEQNVKDFGELPELTQHVLFATDIAVGVELERRKVIEHLGWHRWEVTKLRLRVDRIAHGGNLKPGQEVIAVFIDDVPPKPRNGEESIFIFSQSACGLWTLSAVPKSAQDFDALKRLMEERETHDKFEWVWHDWMPKLAEECSEAGASDERP